jgi:hypothetical protein
MVEACLVVPIGGIGNGVRAPGIHLVGDVWEWNWSSSEPQGIRGGLWWKVVAYTSSETSVGTSKLDGIIEMPCIDFLVHILEGV